MTAREQLDRRRAIRERARNVLVDASAGTGKTSLVVERFVELVAPRDDHPALLIERVAAITFTRKAASELRVRARQTLLRELACLPLGHPRGPALRQALSGLDTAAISTIHGFADRLLRQWPAQARLDPRYQLDEDPERRVRECFEVLVHAAETRTMRELLRDSSVEDRAEEATETVLEVQRAGLRLHSHDSEHWTYHGLDGLIAGFVLHRDLEVREPPTAGFERATFERFADEYLQLVAGLSTATRGGRWLVETGEVLRRALAESDPAVVFREVVARLERGPRGKASASPRQRHEFPDDRRAWDAWKAFDGDTRVEPVRVGSLRDDLLAPLRRWFATRLVRLHPVALHAHAVTKARHQVIDHVDLLLRLRDVLRDDPMIRRRAQALFDHLFVDELQDTDPLQAEIVMFLCERDSRATSWTDVTPASGTLTLVGDPKQSIYRFRRADVATYQRMRELVRRGPHLEVELTSSFRSAPGLVDWINARFEHVLGAASDEVGYTPLSHGRASGARPHVHAVAIALSEGSNTEASRTLEADAMARYLRWLVEISDVCIHDRWTGALRRLTYGDIGVLAISTTHLPVLFGALDRDGVPYASRGGTLFLADPLHRRFLLGLAALADRDDGVAMAALLRPPFFAIDLGDLARARSEISTDRATQARAIVRELRRRRFERSVGATARALVEETGLGATIARGANGAQRLRGLRELCLQLEARAITEQLDFDAVVEQVRCWIANPIKLERPHPVTCDAIRIMTVHQAKGLEFPVVVLWDARTAWSERASYEPWTIGRDGGGWAMRLDHLRWEEPPGLHLADHERRRREAERKRLAYVAVTRARDLLVLPDLRGGHDRSMFATLLGDRERERDRERDASSVLTQPLHSSAAPAPWYVAAAPSTRPEADATTTTERDVSLRAAWDARAVASVRAELHPLAFTDAASPRTLWGKQGRFGTRFGETVHVAIGLVLHHDTPVELAVQHAAERAGLGRQVQEAIADVQRALRTLLSLGIPSPAVTHRLEYPLAGPSGSGDLLAGYADLIAWDGRDACVLDFKTDAPPADASAIPERYADQVLGYARVLAQGAGVARVRAGLLFTADGSIRWLSNPSAEEAAP